MGRDGARVSARCGRSTSAATATEARSATSSARSATRADQLGNTSAVCRASYVHPVVVEAVSSTRGCGARSSGGGGDRRLARPDHAGGGAGGRPPPRASPGPGRGARSAPEPSVARGRVPVGLGVGVGRQREPQLGSAVGPRPRRRPGRPSSRRGRRVTKSGIRGRSRRGAVGSSTRAKLIDSSPASRRAGGSRTRTATSPLARLDPDDDRRLSPPNRIADASRLRIACAT